MSFRACIVKSNCSAWVCIAQTMSILSAAILLRVSKHCIDPGGSLENTLLDKINFYMCPEFLSCSKFGSPGQVIVVA